MSRARHADNERTKKMLKLKMERKIKKEYPGAVAVDTIRKSPGGTNHDKAYTLLPWIRGTGR